MARKKIELSDDVSTVIVKMAEGNPGAASVLGELLQKKGFEKGIQHILSLNDMNIRGSQIWVGYKDHCGMNMDKFVKCIDDRSEDMVRTINTECIYGEYQEIARVNRHDDRLLTNRGLDF